MRRSKMESNEQRSDVNLEESDLDGDTCIKLQKHLSLKGT